MVTTCKYFSIVLQGRLPPQQARSQWLFYSQWAGSRVSGLRMTTSLREQGGSWRNTNCCLRFRCTTPPLPASGGSSCPAGAKTQRPSSRVRTGNHSSSNTWWVHHASPKDRPRPFSLIKKVTKTTTKLEFPAPKRSLLSQQGFRLTRSPINLLRTLVEMKGSCLGLG